MNGRGAVLVTVTSLLFFLGASIATVTFSATTPTTTLTETQTQTTTGPTTATTTTATSLSTSSVFSSNNIYLYAGLVVAILALIIIAIQMDKWTS